MHDYSDIMHDSSKIQPDDLRIGFLLFDKFSNLCLASALEPLRGANTIARRKLFSWYMMTIDDAPVLSSSGIPVTSDRDASACPGGDYLCIVAGYDFQRHASRENMKRLRSVIRRYKSVIALDTGTWLLGETGLFQGRAVTVHWDVHEALQEQFPDLDVCRERVVSDGNLTTCAGGTATLDLMLDVIGHTYGPSLRLAVSSLFMHENMTFKTQARSVMQAIEIMRENVENRLPIAEIAQRVGRTQRGLTVRFQQELGASPSSVYGQIRLGRARMLVEETDLEISEISLRSGFVDPSAMTRAFRKQFGVPPRALRAKPHK